MNLRELREAKRLSQADLAELVGLTKQAISHYECMSRQIPVQVAKKLGSVLGINWWLLYEEE